MPSAPSFAPPRFRDRTLDSYVASTPNQQRAVEACRRFVAGDIRYLVLAGPTGVGKTHLATAAANERYANDRAEYETSPEAALYRERVARLAPWEKLRPDRNEPHVPIWQNVAEMMVGLREDIDRIRDDKEWPDKLEDLRAHRGVVVLDDLGREKVSDWTGETVYALVNRRYEHLLPTIVTTNLTSAELRESPYWPVVSRLAEDGVLFNVEGSDYRLRAKS